MKLYCKRNKIMQKVMLNSNCWADLHSFESYFFDYILKGNDLLVPYFNLGTPNLGFLEEDIDLVFLDRVVCVFKDVKFCKITLNKDKQISRQIIVNQSYSYPLETVFLGGINLCEESSVVEMEIQSLQSFLLLPDDYKISLYPWIIENTKQLKFNLPPNIDKDMMEGFFRLVLEIAPSST